MNLAPQTFGELHLYRPAVVGLCGPAGSGKSTASAFLVSQGYTLVKFAGPLKAMCRAIGLTDEHLEGSLKEVPAKMLQGRTPRYFMQRLGAEFGRDLIGPNFWSDLAKIAIERTLAEGGSVVIDDCRYPNEAGVIRSFGGEIYKLTGRGGIEGAHSSEQFDFVPDYEVANHGSIQDLHGRLERLIGRLR